MASSATDLVRVRRAIAVARTDAVASCPTIVPLLDYEDVTLPAYGFGDDYNVVRAVVSLPEASPSSRAQRPCGTLDPGTELRCT